MPRADNTTGDNAINTVAVISRQDPLEDVHLDTLGDRLGDGQVAESRVPQQHLELPNYITPLPQNVDRHTIQLLQQKGALIIPTDDLVNELLRAFICYVYPSLPVVDLVSCLATISTRNGNTISLLLFQAIMLAGAPFADLQVLQRAGFQTHENAEGALFQRVKLLYEMEVESSPTTIIQALILMTYWEGKLNDTKGRLHWLGIALSIAVGIGLD